MYAECLLGTLVVLIAKQYQWKTLPLKIKKAWSFSFLSISLESGIPFTEDPTKDMQPYNVHWTTFASVSLYHCRPKVGSLRIEALPLWGESVFYLFLYLYQDLMYV